MTISRRVVVLVLLALGAACLLSGCGYVGQGLDMVGNGVHRTANAVRSF